MGSAKGMISALLIHNDIGHTGHAMLSRYNELKTKINSLRDKHSVLEHKHPERIKLGREIDLLNRQLSSIKVQLSDMGKKTNPRDLTQCFREVAANILTKRIYGKILHEANRVLEDSSYKPEIIQILTGDETQAIEKAKDLEAENKKLREKLYNAKNVLQESMPNMLGDLDSKEYDRRTEIIKILSKINRNL